jgi:hypothetical protein
MYSGLDIAVDSVRLVWNRKKKLKLEGNVVQGGQLLSLFPTKWLDAFVAIYCQWRTGNLQLSF